MIPLAGNVAWAILPPGTACWLYLVRGQLIVFTLGILATLGALVCLLFDSRRVSGPAKRNWKYVEKTALM